MKISKKQILIGSILLAVIVCTAGIYLFDRLDSNLWEREFYHCADDLKSRIDQVDAGKYVLPEYDEKVKQDREKLLKWLSRDLFRDVYTIYGGSLGFMEQTYNPENTFKEELIKGLQDALQRRDIAGYAADIAADYEQLSEEEIRQHVQRDDSQILASYYYGVMGEDAEWFLFNRDEDIIVREKTDEEGFKYVYYKFPYLGEGEYGTALPAYGKTSDYYFIQWEEEDYLMVTRRESSGETVDGVGVYSMLGYSLIGTVLCLDKDIDTVRFLSYVFAGTQPYDMRLPDY